MQTAAPAAAPGVGSHHFKEALARLAGGLAIVTCRREGKPLGLLVSSITGLSVDPPRFLFCVRREALAHDALVDAALCGVSILSVDDEAEALSFIDPSQRERRFASPRWLGAASHPPVLDGALSTATCLIDRVIDAGAHSILVVTAQSLAMQPGDPLLSYNRDLRRLHPHAGESGR